MRPPIKAPEPSAPYKNNRSVLHGAIDSETSLLLIPASRPPFFFGSLNRDTDDDLVGQVVVVVTECMGTCPCTFEGEKDATATQNANVKRLRKDSIMLFVIDMLFVVSKKTDVK